MSWMHQCDTYRTGLSVNSTVVDSTSRCLVKLFLKLITFSLASRSPVCFARNHVTDHVKVSNSMVVAETSPLRTS